MTFNLYNTTTNSNYRQAYGQIHGQIHGQIQNSNDARINYLKISTEFSKIFYDTYDNNFNDLGKYFSKNCCITYNKIKFSNFKDFHKKIDNNFIYKFYHKTINGECQPMGPNKVLISINGILNLNYCDKDYEFKETIVLESNDLKNYYITNLILEIPLTYH